MTREEAIEQLKQDRDLCNFNPMTGEEEPMNEDCRKSAEALGIAIKALEQEPILDKIRAEIDKIYEREGNSVDCLSALDELKRFIDKYKSESEET